MFIFAVSQHCKNYLTKLSPWVKGKNQAEYLYRENFIKNCEKMTSNTNNRYK